MTSAGEIPAWIEKCRTERPHRFAIQSDHDAELCQRAFIFKNLTAEMQLYKAVGEKRFEELKALYANGLPESEKKKTERQRRSFQNPWAATETNINPKTGRYTDDAIHRQMSFCRAAGPEKAAQVAASVSAKLGDIFAPGFTRMKWALLVLFDLYDFPVSREFGPEIGSIQTASSGKLLGPWRSRMRFEP